MKDPLIEIGSIIKTAREQAGLSIDELASDSRVSAHHIENIEKANRKELPEEAYLIGFLTKILKALGVANSSSIVSNFKKAEGDYIVQSLVNDNDPEQDSPEKETYFKLYHFYILLVVVLLVLSWFVIRNANRDNEQGTKRKISFKEKVETKIENTEKSKNLIEAQKNNLVQEEILEKPEPKIDYEYKNTYTSGHGDKEIKLRVKEVAWVQIIGMDKRKVLFEGDVFPTSEPNQFKFKDDDGFVIATGNAGAFEVDTGEGPFMLGASGQLIKWFYPKSLKRRFERNRRSARYREQELVGI